MAEIKSIHINGEATITFEEAGEITVEETRVEESIESITMDGLGSFKQLLEDLINSADISKEERNKIMTMTVSEFCETCDSIISVPVVREQAELDVPVTLGIPKMEYLRTLSEQVCPSCGKKGYLSLMDGLIRCSWCYEYSIDVDYLPPLV